jgi:putative photosynthetic complex assembly protein 2
MSFAQLALPIIATVFAWWFSTGIILILVRVRAEHYGSVLAAFALVVAAAMGGVILTASQDTPQAAYCAAGCALLIWGWHEASFLMGKITGPRPSPCPAEAKGWQRFKYATLTVIHHEIALFLTLVALIGLTWGQVNPFAAWTFGILFAMRISAKLNIFLGVPNLTDEFFPPHLEHLKSYLPKRAMNALMPISVILSLILSAWLMIQADRAVEGSGMATGYLVLFALTALALLEHFFMVLPVPDATLWRWAAPLKSSSKAHDARPENQKPKQRFSE